MQYKTILKKNKETTCVFFQFVIFKHKHSVFVCEVLCFKDFQYLTSLTDQSYSRQLNQTEQLYNSSYLSYD